MPTATIDVLPDESIARIDDRLYGHFIEHLGSCIDGGIWVGEDCPIPNIDALRADVVQAIQRIRPAVLRWPGGCFADDYHWRDGIGPRGSRPRTVNLWWGQTVETNGFGTHEFMQLCRLVGAEPYLAANLGSGSPREMRDWVEYCNYAGDSTLARECATYGSPDPFGIRYWGVGNEAWGCGGSFCPEDYAAEYKRCANYMHDLSGTPLFLVAVGPDGNNLDWTSRFFTKLGSFKRLHGFAAHYYAWNREGQFGTATDFTPEQHYGLLNEALAVESLIVQQRSLLDRFDPQRRIALMLDEWGTWHPPTPGRNPQHLWQQNTMRDALVAAMTLDLFHRHADKIAMANIAQLVNVLQSLVMTEGDKMLLTPTYHVFDMYQPHRSATSLRTVVDAPDIHYTHDGHAARLPGLSASASQLDGTLTLSVINAHLTEPVEVAFRLRDSAFRNLIVTELCADDAHAHNTLEAPRTVRPATRGLPDAAWNRPHVLPPASVSVFRFAR